MKPKFDAIIALEAALKKHQIKLEMLIAETAIWAHPNVHKRLIAEGSAARYPHIRRKKVKEDKGKQSTGNLRFDDNSYANVAIKWAIGINRKDIVDYETCHIWPATCYDERYHTAVANLVLLPRALAGLTDHLPDVQCMLQYRAYELYDWYPEESGVPKRPDLYVERWREPESDNLKANKFKMADVKIDSTKPVLEEFVLPITLSPENSVDFKMALLIYRAAEIETFYTDGRREKSIWKANKFKESSNVFGNLRSRPEFRKGRWQELGIEKIHVSIKK
jgi:hypothetical protein